jgi:hypothetical protein
MPRMASQVVQQTQDGLTWQLMDHSRTHGGSLAVAVSMDCWQEGGLRSRPALLQFTLFLGYLLKSQDDSFPEAYADLFSCPISQTGGSQTHSQRNGWGVEMGVSTKTN